MFYDARSRRCRGGRSRPASSRASDRSSRPGRPVRAGAWCSRKPTQTTTRLHARSDRAARRGRERRRRGVKPGATDAILAELTRAAYRHRFMNSLSRRAALRLGRDGRARRARERLRMARVVQIDGPALFTRARERDPAPAGGGPLHHAMSAQVPRAGCRPRIPASIPA